MRALKVSLTTCLILGFGALFSLPFIIRMKPPRDAAQIDRLRYALGMTSLTMFLFVIFAVVLILAWRLMRKQQEQFVEAQQNNMRELIEATLSDHEHRKA